MHTLCPVFYFYNCSLSPFLILLGAAVPDATCLADVFNELTRCGKIPWKADTYIGIIYDRNIITMLI